MLAASLCANASADNVIAVGPVERVSVDGSVVQVLGQVFKIRSSHSIEGRAEYSDTSLNLRLGAYLYIEGERSADGSLVASSFLVDESPYVAGASEVLLAGIVSKFDQLTGLATIGSAQIYVSDASVEVATPISVGATITVVGYQANPRQQIWATQIDSNEPISILETGIDSLSIQGTGKQSIQGTGVKSLSIQGTGKQSIQGTGVKSLSIQGTGKQSIQGTGANSLSIQGTGKQSIQGTGVKSLSIQGTGKQSIQGTGANSLSIQGTGKQSIQGTGANSLSIQGTGKQSIQGTGVKSLSIQGTGRQSIQGTG